MGLLEYQNNMLQALKNIDEEIDSMVRDFCSVVPRPKSEVRERIVRFVALSLQALLKEKREEVEKLETPIQKTTEETVGLIDYGFQMAKNHVLALLTPTGEKEL